MSSDWVWFGLMALTLIGEVMTGTFYLLMVAVGMAAAGVAAVLGVDDAAVQIAVCAAVALLATYVLRKLGVFRKRSQTPLARDSGVNMEIGQKVKVESWREDGTARVWYRGAYWEAVLAPGADARPGNHVITALQGNSLVLRPA